LSIRLNQKGDASLLLILVFSAILLLVLMPLSAFILEQNLLMLVEEDLETSLGLSAYLVYQHLDTPSLGQGKLQVKKGFVDVFNRELNGLCNHPQVLSLKVESIWVEGNQVAFDINIVLKPTLYRATFKGDNTYDFTYYIEMPMDRKDRM